MPSSSGDFYTAPTSNIERLTADGFHIVPIELSRWSAKLSGIIVIALGINSAGLLTNRHKGKPIRFDEKKRAGFIEPQSILPNFNGNRISVNGFRLGSFKIKNLLRLGDREKLSVLIDLDAKFDDSVEYDVSRERLTRKGERHLRNEILCAVLSALIQTGTIDRMVPELTIPMMAFSDRFPLAVAEEERNIDAPDAMANLFRVIQGAIPNDHWPRGMHQQIAERFGISASLASKVISLLLKRGLISNPNDANRTPESNGVQEPDRRIGCSPTNP